MVLRERGAVTGITSAATIFMIASIGMTVGAGFPVTGIFTTLLILVSLVFLGLIEDRIGLHTRNVDFYDDHAAGNDPSILERVHQIVKESGFRRCDGKRTSLRWVPGLLNSTQKWACRRSVNC